MADPEPTRHEVPLTLSERVALEHMIDEVDAATRRLAGLRKRRDDVIDEVLARVSLERTPRGKAILDGGRLIVEHDDVAADTARDEDADATPEAQAETQTDDA